jgi:signal transduction histidine kinase
MSMPLKAIGRTYAMRRTGSMGSFVDAHTGFREERELPISQVKQRSIKKEQPVSIARKIMLILAVTLVVSATGAWLAVPFLSSRLSGNEDQAMVREVSELILASGLAVGLIVAFVAAAWAQRLVGRIESIAATARAVRSGEVDTHVEDDDPDEIGDLARVFNDMTRTLAQSLHAKDEFIASVSHEVRTPLTAVLGLSTEIAENGGDMTNDEITELCGIIASQTSEVAHIVEDLLTVARVDRGVLMLHTELLLLEPEVDAAMTSMPSDMELRTDIGVVPCAAYADSTRVRQILRNLLTNAYRYGGRWVELRVSPASSNQVSIRVRDDGKGVSAEDAAAIFAPYFSSHVREGLTESVGLGLTVSRKLARAMGGDLRYRRVAGWTVFELLLPAAPMPAELVT